MNRIDIRLPGKGPSSVIAIFNNCTSAVAHPSQGSDQDSQRPMEPIAQRALGPANQERWLAPGPVESYNEGRFAVTRARDYQFACISLPVRDNDIREATKRAYQELLALIERSDYPQLVRFWNYIPNINTGTGDQEVYRQFCWGRAEAFNIDEQALPAATGIGSQDGVLRISALSAVPALSVQHLENPRQVSAYHYPRQYGPKSPSFARATEISADDQALLLLSGTASIVQHETQHPENLCAQTAETQRNIAQLLAAAHHHEQLQPVNLRCYLRNPQDLEGAKAAYASAFAGFPEPVYVQGDICRSALVMEIDGVFSTDP